MVCTCQDALDSFEQLHALRIPRTQLVQLPESLQQGTPGSDALSPLPLLSDCSNTT